MRRRLRQFVRLDWRARFDLAIAVVELLRANRRLAKMTAPPAFDRFEVGSPDGPSADFPSAARGKGGGIVDRVAWAIPRAAEIVPWRSDCLRQAYAAQTWLARNGVASSIRFGAKKTPTGQLSAHAWLIAGGHVVAGGNISDFAAFNPPERAHPRSSSDM